MWEEEEKEGGWLGRERRKNLPYQMGVKEDVTFRTPLRFRGTYSFNLPFLLKNRKKHIFTKKYKKHASSTQVWNEAKNRMSSEPKILYNFQRRTCHMLMGNYAVRLTRSCTIQIDSQIAKQDVSAELFRKKNRKWGREGACKYVVSCEYFKTNPIMSVFGLLILPEEKETKNEEIYWYE